MTKRTATKKPARKTVRIPASGLLEKTTQKILTELLIAILKTPTLRKRAGIKLTEGGSVSLGCEVNFLTSAEMKKTNRKFRGKHADTDVLSFPAPAIFRKTGLLGELLISSDILVQQAAEQGHSWKEELRVLLAHGLLHLLDFDHERGGAEARKMRRWESELLEGGGTPGLIARVLSAKK